MVSKLGVLHTIMRFSIWFLFFFSVPVQSHNMVALSPSLCSARYCPFETTKCFLNTGCRNALLCHARCFDRKDEVGCNLLCQFNYGYKNERYINVLQCLAKHKCLPVLPMNGKCLARNNTRTVSNLTDYGKIKGRWWIVRGLNCGQDGWTGAFDAFPCQYDQFVQEKSNFYETTHNLTKNNSAWVDNIGYCGGKDSVCSTEYIHTKARVDITTPGVLNHYYLDAPLLPQNERWYVLSWPHPDWMLYIYCGFTPTGPYAGGSVVTRTGRKSSDIPVWIENEFIEVSSQNGFDYETMCQSDNTECNNTGTPSSLMVFE